MKVLVISSPFRLLTKDNAGNPATFDARRTQADLNRGKVAAQKVVFRWTGGGVESTHLTMINGLQGLLLGLIIKSKRYFSMN
jgi:hypothetical protein